MSWLVLEDIDSHHHCHCMHRTSRHPLFLVVQNKFLPDLSLGSHPLWPLWWHAVSQMMICTDWYLKASYFWRENRGWLAWEGSLPCFPQVALSVEYTYVEKHGRNHNLKDENSGHKNVSIHILVKLIKWPDMENLCITSHDIIKDWEHVW